MSDASDIAFKLRSFRERVRELAKELDDYIKEIEPDFSCFQCDAAGELYFSIKCDNCPAKICDNHRNKCVHCRKSLCDKCFGADDTLCKSCI